MSQGMHLHSGKTMPSYVASTSKKIKGEILQSLHKEGMHLRSGKTMPSLVASTSRKIKGEILQSLHKEGMHLRSGKTMPSLVASTSRKIKGEILQSLHKEGMHLRSGKTMPSRVTTNSKKIKGERSSMHKEELHLRKKIAPRKSNKRINSEGSTLLVTEPSTFTNVSALPFDWSSVEGKFSWGKIGDDFLPFITRGTLSLCSVRMIEATILQNHYSILKSNLYTCTSIRSYLVTQNEADLLSHINDVHCENRFGLDLFNMHDLIIEIIDAENFYNFLKFCYNKLCNPCFHSSPICHAPCGFLRINDEADVSYILRNGEKYIPLFYFDGINHDFMNIDPEPLNSWESAYIKFCCKIQGIKEGNIKTRDFCSLMKFSDLKMHLPSNTTFVEYWLYNEAKSRFFGDENENQVTLGTPK